MQRTAQFHSLRVSNLDVTAAIAEELADVLLHFVNLPKNVVSTGPPHREDTSAAWLPFISPRHTRSRNCALNHSDGSERKQNVIAPSGSKNNTKLLKTRHGLVWFFIYFR